MKFYRSALSNAAVILLLVLPAGARSGEIDVDAAGFPGKPLSSVNEKWLKGVLGKKYDFVVLLMGTNDACNSKALAEGSSFKNALDLVVRTVLSQNCRLLLVTVPPCNESCLFERHARTAFGEMPPNERIKKINSVIADAARKRALPLADFHAVAIKYGTAGRDSLLRIPENSGTSDGIHLTEAGYEKLARCIALKIGTSGPMPKRILCLGDSLTYGVGMKDPSKTYPAQLKRILNRSQER